MRFVLAVATYLGYVAIIVLYSVKIVKYLKLPIHLRSEVYPVIPGDRTPRERSCYETLDWWTKPRHRNSLQRIWFLISDCFLLSEYFRRDRSYWLVLYPWHIGFILIITFHILSFFGAILESFGIPVRPEASPLLGVGMYYASLATGALSFTAGLFGSIGVLVKRVVTRDLRDYAAPQNYFTYLFLLAVFLSGFIAWVTVDPTFSGYREFWKGLIRFNPIDVEPATAVHILLFALLLIYLPFTRSLHYITRLFGFLLIRWDDEPNLRRSPIEGKVEEALNQKLTWDAPHIKPGSAWRDLAMDEGSREGDKD
jgi:nitrate reductase gamma subunit